jgi:hypothetical protein
MRAILCSCDFKVATGLKQLLVDDGLSVCEVEPNKRSSASGMLLRVSNGKLDVAISLDLRDCTTRNGQFDSRIIVYIPRRWRDYLLRRDPHLELGLRIRSILEKQTMGQIAVENLI